MDTLQSTNRELRCLLLGMGDGVEIIKDVARRLGFEAWAIYDISFEPPFLMAESALVEEAVIVLADVSEVDSLLFFHLGLAIGHEKPLVLFATEGSKVGDAWLEIEPIFYSSPADLDEKVEDVLKKFIAHQTVPETITGYRPLRRRKRSVSNIEGPFEKRVFVGGSYNTHLSLLLEIHNFIRNCSDMVPILAKDYDMPRDQTHKYSLILLHNSPYAIFEVSAPAGQLMELERSRDYETKVLVVYNTANPELDAEHVTSMVKSYGATCKGYSTLDQLRTIVEVQTKEWAAKEPGRS